MKIQKISLFVILIALIVYTAFWYKKSSELESHFKTQIDKMAHDDKTKYLLTYDSIEKGGYPFNFSIALVNPTISEIRSSETNTQGMEIRVNGKIIDHFTLTGALKSIEYTGKANIEIPPQNEEKAANFLVEGNMFIENELESLIPVAALKKLTAIDNIIDNLWEYLNFDNSQVKISDLKISDVQRNTPIVAIDRLNIDFDRAIKDKKNQKIHFSTNAKGLDMHQLLAYSSILNPPEGFSEKLYIDFITAVNSKQGKIEFNFDLDLNIPNEEELKKISQKNLVVYLTQPFPEFSIAFDGFSKGALDRSNLKGRLEVRKDEENQELITVKLDGNFNGSKAYVEALNFALEKISQEASLLEPADDNQKIIQNLLVNHQADLKDLIPKIDEFGTIQKIIDFNIQLDKKQLYSKIKLTELALLSEIYGLQLKGEAEGGMRTTSGQFTLDLLKYQAMVQDFTDYINKIVRVLNLAQFNFHEISPSLKNSILHYLQEVSNEPQIDSKDLHITFSYSDNGVKVGTLNLPEFLQKSAAIREEIEEEIGQ